MDHSTDTAGFHVRAEAGRDLMVITLTGFFDVSMVSKLRDARAQARARLTCPPNQQVTLIDVSALKLQAQALLPAFTAEIEEPSLRSRRVAFVVANMLCRMQVRRLSERSDMRIVESVAEAEAFLFAPDEDAVAA